MKEITISRAFAYNGIRLEDPNPAMQPDAVREFFVPQYPELTTAVVEGPERQGNVATYTFRRAAGSKGRGQAPSPVRARLQALVGGDGDDAEQQPFTVDSASNVKAISRLLLNIAKSNETGRPQNVPGEAHGLWG